MSKKNRSEEEQELKAEIKALRETLAGQQMALREAGLPVIVLVEGWAAAGKGSLIGELISELDPRFYNVVSPVITPERDGRVVCIDKEVVITDCEGQLVGASLLAELARRGITGKRAVILNDTVAVLLGGAAQLDKDAYSGFIGQVSGTGTNTCVSLPVSQIGKLGQSGERGMVVNLESGEYDGIEGGDYDRMLDAGSHAPGTKRFEKLTAGVYLGELARLMLRGAADEGLLS